MTSLTTARLILVAWIVFVSAVVPVMPAFAQEESARRGTFCFEAGVACPGFALQDLTVGDPGNSVVRQFYRRGR